MSFKDCFSAQWQSCRKHCPRYPVELFDWLADSAPGRGLAVDVATGSGEAAVALAERFDAVIATDASAGTADLLVVKTHRA